MEQSVTITVPYRGRLYKLKKNQLIYTLYILLV